MNRRSKSGFEGWYFKQRGEQGPLSLIVGRAEDEAFLQILTPQFSACLSHPTCDYYADSNRLFIRIGESYLTRKGLLLREQRAGVSLQGQLRFGPLHPIRGDIMGAFALLPGMECYHGIQSTHHSLQGILRLNGQPLCFDGGRGYIESDRGRSFPGSYLWLQCNDFDLPGCTFTAAVAEIPYAGRSFTGHILHLRVGGRAYRFATYFGVRSVLDRPGCLIVEQGPHRLEVFYHADRFGALSAPSLGQMRRTVRESVSGRVELRLYEQGRLLARMDGRNAGVELAGR